MKMRNRFRGFLPIVIDVETAGVNPQTDALLEICAIPLCFNEQNELKQLEPFHAHIEPFSGANLDKASLEFNQIDPFHPFRLAKEEKIVLQDLFTIVKNQLKKQNCSRAVLVGHNAWFDLLFLKSAIARTKLSSPFHQFTSFDTATLSALVYGQTVLAKALEKAKIPFNLKEAHSALYDAKKTAELFCKIVNNFSEFPSV